MKAVTITDLGGVDRLHYGDIPAPEASSSQVLVRVRACSVNRLDIFTREGSHGTRLRPSGVPGLDIAGDVVQAPAGSTFEVGDRVMGVASSGAYAEYAVASPDRLAPIPPSLTFEEAAAVPTAFCAAWHCIMCKAKLQLGETVLVIAGGSGVGSAAIQIARAASARVITTVGAQEKVEKALSLGADAVIVHYQEDIRQRVMELTDGEGVDLVYDHVGQATWEKSFNSLKVGGRYVTNGVTSGHMAAIHLGRLWTRDLSVLGTSMRVEEDLQRVVELVGRGLFHPVIDRELPLSEAQQAHSIVESGRFFGKIVLRVD